MRVVSLIEPLEARIAPAALTYGTNGKSASYLDQLGDTVTVTTTKGNFHNATFTFDPGAPGQLTELALSNDFSGANVAFSIKPVNGGTDQVNIGYIDALNMSLGSVSVPGDLGRIDVGGGSSSMALSKLTVNTLGALGDVTQGGQDGSFGWSTASHITGTAGIVSVAGNMDGALSAQDYKSKPGTGNIQQLNIGGSLDGNTSTGAGEILFTGTLTTAVIGGGIEGGSGQNTGSVSGVYAEFAKIGTITVKGSVPDDPNPSPLPGVAGTSILGGSGALSGCISAATVGSVTVAGDVYGSTGSASGSIQGGITLSKVNIGGSLIGGNFVSGDPSGANSAGLVFGGTTLGSVVIGKNISGGSGLNSGEVYSTGMIQSVTVMGDVAGGSAGEAASGSTSAVNGFSGVIKGNAIGNVTIAGSLIGGNLVTGDTNQTGANDGAILGTTTIGSVYIGSSVIGGSGPSSGSIQTHSGGLGSSVIGGAGASSGLVQVAGTLGTVVLTHDLTGGTGTGSGAIIVNGPVNTLVIGGGITGGTEDNTGILTVFGLLKSATIQNSITGSDSNTTLLTDTGYVQADGIGTMTVGGSLVAGQSSGSGTLDGSGAIRSTVAITNLTIGGIVGNSSNPAIISAEGLTNLATNAKTDIAIQNLTVKGNVNYGDILAGYSADTQNSTMLLGTGVSADAQIGTVTINGTLAATNIIAGVGPGTNGFFGTATSSALSGAGVTDMPSIISSISKVVITGNVVAPGASTPDTYGIAAQYIASASVNGSPLVLTAGPDNDTFANNKAQVLPITSPPTANANVYLYEV